MRARPKDASYDLTIFTDAAGRNPQSLGGWAGWTTDKFAPDEHLAHSDPSIRVARGLWSTEEALEHSTYQELVAVLNVLSSFNRDSSLNGKSTQVKTDNQATFFIINKAGSRRANLHRVCKRLWWYCLSHDIVVTAIWIPRELTKAKYKTVLIINYPPVTSMP